MKTKQHAGYGLLELLIALAILGLLLAVAMPAVSGWRERQRIQALQTGLFQLTSKARYFAMTGQSRVTLCSLTPQGQCQQSWTESVSSFTDGNGNRRLDPGEEILSTLYLPSGFSLYWRGMLPNNSIHFSSQGVTFVSNGTMSICPTKSGSRTGTLVISRQGRIKVSQDGALCPQ